MFLCKLFYRTEFILLMFQELGPFTGKPVILGRLYRHGCNLFFMNRTFQAYSSNKLAGLGFQIFNFYIPVA